MENKQRAKKMWEDFESSHKGSSLCGSHITEA